MTFLTFLSLDNQEYALLALPFRGRGKQGKLYKAL